MAGEVRGGWREGISVRFFLFSWDISGSNSLSIFCCFGCWFKKKKGIVSPLCCLHFKLLKPLSSITSHKEIKNRVKPNRPHCSCELNFFSRTLQYTFKTSLHRNKNNQDKKILQSTHSSPVTCMQIETFLVFYPCKNILMAPK